MAYSKEYLSYILEQLSEFNEVEEKKMFGGIGLFKEGKMFGMIANDIFKLKVDDFNMQDFIDSGVQPHFDPSKKKGMPYGEVPVEIVEDKKELRIWAQKSFDAATRNKNK